MRAPLLLLLLSLLGACRGPAVVLVSLVGLQKEAGVAIDRARVALTLDGVRLLRQEEFPGPPARFALRFPAGTTGALDLLVEGIDRDGCAAAQGQGRVVLEGTDLLEAEVQMSPRAPRRCADRVRVFPAQGTVELTSIAVGAGGDVFVAGVLSGKLTLPGFERESQGQDGLVARLSPEGAPIWVRTYDGAGDEKIRAMALDPAGEILITGYYTGTKGVCRGGKAARGKDAFLARLDPARGDCLWEAQAGSAADDEGLAVAVDPAGNAVFSGTFKGVLNLDEHMLSSDSGQSVFFDVHDRKGARITYGQVDLPGADAPYGAATDKEGNFYLTGSARRGEGGGTDTFVVCYRPLGNPCWQREWRTSSPRPMPGNGGTRILVVPNGDIVVAGHYVGDVDFGGEVLHNPKTDFVSPFVLRLSGRDRSRLWVRSMSGSGEDGIWGLAQDLQGDLVVCGYAGLQLSIEGAGRTLDIEEGLDIFALHLGKQGEPGWLRGLGGRGGGQERARCWGAAVDPQGRTWLAGDFSFPRADFGLGPIQKIPHTGNSDTDGVVLRLP
jgi:hypothetical protein